MPRNVNVVLKRTHFEETYTLGELRVNGEFIARTLEYPWRRNAAWTDEPGKGGNFMHTSCIREGVYQGHLRSDHRRRDGSVQWRLELHGTLGRTAIQFHEGNTLVQDSQGCILVGQEVIRHVGVEPRIIHSQVAMDNFIKAILGKLLDVRNPSDWATMMRELMVTVRVIGMPPGAWHVA